MNKEKRSYMYPSGFVQMSFTLTDAAIRWLNGTTNNDKEESISNAALFQDLLANMQLTSGNTDKRFRRPQTLQAGTAQYSELVLSQQWNMGRKRIRRLLDTMTRIGLIRCYPSTIASIMVFPCITSWTLPDGSVMINPYQGIKSREEI